ncbi:MAG: acyl-CoA dehydrogenase family protein [Rudaea sp.]
MNNPVPLLPLDLLERRLPYLPHRPVLDDYQAWWDCEGRAISEAVDRAGTPALRLFDRFGKRVDEVLYPPDYWRMLREGYRAGVVWRSLKEQSLITPYLLGYITSFYDPGLYCPYVVTLSTAVPLAKYGAPEIVQEFLPPLLQEDGRGWQGATWMTESGGGSDLGAAVETLARDCGDHWELTGDKYFCSNVGAEAAVVAARPERGPTGIRGLELFLTPRTREGGRLNYSVRRLKDKLGTRSVPTGEVELRDSHAFLLGKRGQGTYLILETLNLSRVANSMGSVALAQRALAEAWAFACGRVAFGKPVAEHPLLARQFEERWRTLNAALALAWEAVTLLESVWQEMPPYSDRYHLFRLVAHLAKFWTAELAVQYSEWALEVHGGAGIVMDLPVERLLRESIILPIWEGTPQRQILDGLEVMERKRAHQLLWEHLQARGVEPGDLKPIQTEVDRWLAIPHPEREAVAEPIFRRLAESTGNLLAQLAESRA